MADLGRRGMEVLVEQGGKAHAFSPPAVHSVLLVGVGRRDDEAGHGSGWLAIASRGGCELAKRAQENLPKQPVFIGKFGND